MNRFPMLSTYAGLLQLLAAAIILIGGVGSILVADNSESGFDVVRLAVGLVATGLSALPLLALAEIIGLFLTMEDHLLHIREALSNVSLNSAPASHMGTGRVPGHSVSPPVPLATPSTPNPVARVAGLTAVVNTEWTPIRNSPIERVLAAGELLFGVTVTLIGRTEDSQWAQVQNEGPKPRWVRVADLLIDGDIRTLPITFPER